MNKIEKFLRTLSKNEHALFILLQIQLKKDYSLIPGIKKLAGKKNYYRVRVGKYRIIFEAYSKYNVRMVKIAKRDDQTYKNL